MAESSGSGKIMVISSDGHATARMEDYASYLDPAFRDEFREFLVEYRKHGSHTFEEPALRSRLDPDLVEEWVEQMIRPGRIDGNWDPGRRLKELEREGVVAEVLFPDFGLPFELYSPLLAAQLGYGARTQAQVDAGDRAYNRWLADFCGTAPRPVRRDGLRQLPRRRRGDRRDPPGQGRRAARRHDADVRREAAAVRAGLRPGLEHHRGPGAGPQHARRHLLHLQQLGRHQRQAAAPGMPGAAVPQRRGVPRPAG